MGLINKYKRGNDKNKKQEYRLGKKRLKLKLRRFCRKT